MARVHEITVSTEERFPAATDERRPSRNFSVSVRLRADYDEGGGPLLDQIGRLQGCARRAVVQQREHILRGIQEEDAHA